MIDLKLLHDCGFSDVKQLEDNIFCVSNFLSKEELNTFDKIIDSLSEDDWNKLNYLQDPDWEDKFYEYKDELISSIVRNKLDKLMFGLSGSVVYGFNRILRQRPKDHMIPHVDAIFDTVSKLNRDYASIVYLNDDYVGGELSYINLNIEIKPPAGSLMIFKTGSKYLHEVKPVSGNKTRYCLPAWIFSNTVDKE